MLNPSSYGLHWIRKSMINPYQPLGFNCSPILNKSIHINQYQQFTKYKYPTYIYIFQHILYLVEYLYIYNITGFSTKSQPFCSPSWAGWTLPWYRPGGWVPTKGWTNINPWDPCFEFEVIQGAPTNELFSPQKMSLQCLDGVPWYFGTVSHVYPSRPSPYNRLVCDSSKMADAGC